MSQYRSYRWPLLVFAWVAFLVSLALPALPTPSLLAMSLGFFYSPVFDFIMVDVFLSNFRASGIPPALMIGLSMGAFLFSPVLALRPPKRFLLPLWQIARCLLLVVWILPLVWSSFFNNSGFRGSNLDAGSLLWGYYVFALAHTAAFIACIMPPPTSTLANRGHGFPVVLENESAEPPPLP